jgi:hypothetical protein
MRAVSIRRQYEAIPFTQIILQSQDLWQIESFSKSLKNKLKIKTLAGTSANAVKIHLWTALIVILLLRYRQLKAKFSWSLSNLVAILRSNLFVHRDLWNGSIIPTKVRLNQLYNHRPNGNFKNLDNNDNER